MSRRHHFVSQVYLRRFEASAGKAWVYDKESGPIPGPTAVGNVGLEKGFYALPDDPNYPYDNPEIIEGQLAAFEEGFVASMDVAVRIADKGGNGSLNERALLAKTVAFQHLRTRAWRDQMSAVYKSAYEQMINTVWAMASDLSGQERPAGRVVVGIEDDRAWALQARTMWSHDTINQLAERIYRCIWIIVLNKSGRPFVTSDSPVAAEVVAVRSAAPTMSSQHERLIEIEGWAAPGGDGSQAFLPLTPNHALVMLDPGTFPEAVDRQGQVLCVEGGTVDKINAAQVAYSQRWVYASSADFSGAVPPSEYASLSPADRRFRLPL